MKRVVKLLLAVVIIVCFAQTVFANTGIRITLNGTDITPTGVQAELIDGRVFVPLRFVSERLNATVDWNNDTREVTINNDIVHTVGSSYAIVRSTSRAIDIGVSSYIKDGSTMVSVRMISDGLGVGVNWNAATRTVELGGSTNTSAQPPPSQPQEHANTSAGVGAGNDYVNYTSMVAYLEATIGRSNPENEIQRLGGSIRGDSRSQYYLNYFLKPNMAFVPMSEFPSSVVSNDLPQGITVKESKWEFVDAEIKSYFNSEFSEYRYLAHRESNYLVLEHNGRTYMAADSYAKYKGFDSFHISLSSDVPDDQGVVRSPRDGKDWVSGGQYASWINNIMYYKLEGNNLVRYDWINNNLNFPKNLAIWRGHSLNSWSEIFVDVEAMDRYLSQMPQGRVLTFVLER
jgi:hypothetical protein